MRAEVGDRIVAGADLVGVVAGAAGHGVVAGAAVENIVAAIAGDGVGKGIAGAIDVVGAGQGEVLDHRVARERAGDAGADRVGAARVGDRLVAGTAQHIGVVAGAAVVAVAAGVALERVVAAGAGKDVVASVAFENVGVPIAGQRVASSAAVHVLDVADSILSYAADRHGGERTAIERHLDRDGLVPV